MIIEKIMEEEDKIQALSLIQSRWPEKDLNYLNFFLGQNSLFCLQARLSEIDELIGVLLSRLANKNDVWWLEIPIIIVKEGQRRNGYGSQLLKALEKRCRGDNIKYLFLNSGEVDLADGSFLFYHKNGFKVVGAVRNPAESLLYFQKDL